MASDSTDDNPSDDSSDEDEQQKTSAIPTNIIITKTSSEQNNQNDDQQEEEEEEQQQGFEFNGQIYPTYQDMVSAKRERNRLALEKATDEISTVLGDEYKKKSSAAKSKSSASSSNGRNRNSSKSNNNKRKRKQSSSSDISSGGASVQTPTPLRRNPKRAARPIRSPSTLGYISITATTKRGGDGSDDDDVDEAGSCNSSVSISDAFSIPSIISGDDDGPTIPMSTLLADKSHDDGIYKDKDETANVPEEPLAPLQNMGVPYDNDHGSSSDESSPTIPQDLLSFDHIDVATHNSDASPGVRVKPDIKISVMNDENLSYESSSDDEEGDEYDLMVKNRHMKDISACLEQIVVTGKLAQERECAWNEYINRNSDDDSSVVLEEEDSSENDEDICSSQLAKDYQLKKRNDNSVNLHLSDGHDKFNTKDDQRDTGNFGSFVDDDSDIVIPDEYLATHQTDKGEELLPLDDPVKYNNIIRKRNSYYTSKVSGDGIDPHLFVMESRSNNGAKNGNRDSLESNKYISSLLQRCWDQAVHRASNTILVNPAPSCHEAKAAVSLDNAQLESEMIDAATLNQNTIASILENEAKDTVCSILDILMGDDNLVKQMLDPQQQPVNWRHVLKSLKAAVTKQEEKFKTQSIDPLTPSYTTQCTSSLNQSSFKLLFMRLVEQNEYGTCHPKIKGR